MKRFFPSANGTGDSSILCPVLLEYPRPLCQLGTLPPPAPSVQISKSLEKPPGRKSAQMPSKPKRSFHLMREAQEGKGDWLGALFKISTSQGKEKLSVKICVIRRFPKDLTSISMLKAGLVGTLEGIVVGET